MEGSFLQWVSAVASSAAVATGIRVIFMAGRLIQTVEDHDKRIERLEKRADAM